MYAPYQPPALAPASHNLSGTPVPGHIGPGPGQGQGPGPLMQHQVAILFDNMCYVLYPKSQKES